MTAAQKRSAVNDVLRGIKASDLASPAYLGALSGTSRQALRTGGWANPSRMSELKFVDTNIAGGATGITIGVQGLLNGLVPGSNASQRIGRKVVMKSVYLRYRIQLAATTVGGGKMRLMLVYDKQSNAAAPAITDILLTNNWTSPNNLSNRDRFTVLCDHISDCISVGGDFLASGEIYKKVNLETFFNAGVAGTIGDITSGSLYLLYGNSGTFTTAQPTIDYDTRIRYSDN